MKHEKIFLILIIIIVFSSVYFPINYLTSFRETHNLNTFIDSLIPFLPLTIFIYGLVYLFWFVPFFLTKKIKPLRKLTLGYSILMLISGLIFLIFPIKVIRPEIVVNNLFDLLVKTFFSLDLPHNAFPSVHASFTFFLALFSFKYLKKYQLIIYLITLSIIISTLTLKQHYFLDVVAGLILSIIVYLIIFRK